MAVTSSDLVAYRSANRPKSDAASAGGAIDVKRFHDFVQLAANDSIYLKSTSASDVMSAAVEVRDAAGLIVSTTAGVNGTAGVDLSALGTAERFLDIELLADAVGTITVGRGTVGSPGPLIRVIPPGKRGFGILFYDSVSTTVERKVTEKMFWKNEHASLALTNAKGRITADPAGVMKTALEDAKGDSSSLANRLADNTSLGLTFVDDAVQQDVPGTFLGASESIGAWIEMTLAANNAPIRSTVTLELAGASA
jgi:hypothetical protein